MSLDYVRQIVSGNKARYVDADSAVDLDLVYVTDRIIIMGWPATGWASAYRNRRKDVLKFIRSRHGEKWWVWNLCPLYENAYSAESMSNRVSRYPFPDHHPPPLALLPLAVREMTGWLGKDPENVAIIHCKAGKGRSGTLLCSYLLSLTELPPAPQSILSYSSKERGGLEDGRIGKTGRKDAWILVGGGGRVDEVEVEDRDSSSGGGGAQVKQQGECLAPPGRSPSTISLTTISDSVVSEDISYNPIAIGDESDASDPQQYDRKDGRVDKVFKLHSSRRMKPSSSGRGVSIPSQRRWCRYINLYYTRQSPSTITSVPPTTDSAPPRIRLLSITVKVKAPHSWQKPIARAVIGSGQGKAWASIARYDDEYVETLRKLARADADREVSWGGVGGNGEFDTHKMFRSCGKMVAVSTQTSEDGHTISHRLELEDEAARMILDRNREFRMKLHLSSLPLGWAWIIPAFHLPEPTPTNSPPRKHVLAFPRTQVDFAIGPGLALKSVEIELEELPEESQEQPVPLMSEQQEKEKGVDEKEEKVKEDGE